jgi:hypothetical protein
MELPLRDQDLTEVVKMVASVRQISCCVTALFKLTHFSSDQRTISFYQEVPQRLAGLYAHEAIAQ